MTPKVDGRGTTTYTFDSEGRMVQIAAPEGTIQYEFDARTGRKTRTHTNNSDIRFDYDALGRLGAVSVHRRNGQNLVQPEVTTYAYSAVGSRDSQVLPNGIITTYDYDNLNRLINLSHHNAGHELLAEFAYTLAPTGQRTGVIEKMRQANNALATTTIGYTYDQLNRLTQETSSSDVPEATFSTDYTYDMVGNRIRKATSRNADGQAETIVYGYNWPIG